MRRRSQLSEPGPDMASGRARRKRPQVRGRFLFSGDEKLRIRGVHTEHSVLEMILAEFRCVHRGDAVVLFDVLERLSNSIPWKGVPWWQPFVRPSRLTRLFRRR